MAIRPEIAHVLASLGDGGKLCGCKAHQKYMTLLKQQSQGKIELASEQKQLLDNDAMHNYYALGNTLDHLEKRNLELLKNARQWKPPPSSLSVLSLSPPPRLLLLPPLYTAASYAHPKYWKQ